MKPRKPHRLIQHEPQDLPPWFPSAFFVLAGLAFLAGLLIRIPPRVP